MKNTKNWIFKKITPFIALSLSASTALAASATGGKTSGSGIIPIPNPLAVDSFSGLLNKIIDFLIIAGAPLVTLMVIWAAFKIMSAGGDVDKVIEGKQTIKWAVLGFVLLLISKGTVLVINNIIGLK